MPGESPRWLVLLRSLFSGLYTGSDFADFLLGLPQQAAVQYGPGLEQFRSRTWDVFFQDDWRASAKVTVNAGLRYETQTNIGDHLDWAPRIGFAWAPGAKGNKPSKTVLRGGWGIFYDRFSANSTLQTLRYNGVTVLVLIAMAYGPFLIRHIPPKLLSPG